MRSLGVKCQGEPLWFVQLDGVGGRCGWKQSLGSTAPPDVVSDTFSHLPPQVLMLRHAQHKGA